MTALSRSRINGHSSFFAQMNYFESLGIVDTEGQTSLPKVIWEQGRVAAAVPGAGWHKWLRIRNVCIVFLKDTCVRKRAVF